jgi:rhodanese-related sulfurtransferase
MTEFTPASDVYDRREAVQILDVREPYEWEAGRIEGAIHKPMGRILGGDVEGLDPDRPVVVYCRTANRSEVAALMLEARGFRATVMEGGIEAWDQQGLPYTTPQGEPGRVG